MPSAIGNICSSSPREGGAVLRDTTSPEALRDPTPLRTPSRTFSSSIPRHRQLERIRNGSGTPEPVQARGDRRSKLATKNTEEKRKSPQLKRPSIATNTFEVLEAVSEAKSQSGSVRTASETSNCAVQLCENAGVQVLNDPLSVAARNIPPLEEQIEKHREGLYEWILAVNISKETRLQRECCTPEIQKLYYGCNLLPGSSETGDAPTKYFLVTTPLRETETVLELFSDAGEQESMAVETGSGLATPVKVSEYASVSITAEAPSPDSMACNRGDDSFKIEDSIEEMDRVEEQLEEFHFDHIITEEHLPGRTSPRRADREMSCPSIRFATPQPRRSLAKSTPESAKTRSAHEPRCRTLRQAQSMTLDSHKSKKSETESTRESAGTSSSLTPRSVKLEKKPSSVSLRATAHTQASLRRLKSTFELPGEAISRRKREEHQAQLKAQEEEERKRREFKARPPPSRTTPAHMPRETIASRARQDKAVAGENPTGHTIKKLGKGIDSRPHSALSSRMDQPPSRGQGPLDRITKTARDGLTVVRLRMNDRCALEIQMQGSHGQ